MSTQQDIYAAGFESRPPMLNKENYVPWSSRLLCYAKSRPNGKLIHNSIINGPYVRRMIPEPEADDQAIQTILLGLPEDIYAAVDRCETAQDIWLRVQQIMKGSDIGIQEKKVKLFNEYERFTSNEGESIESYNHRFLKLMNDLKRNKHFPKKIASNLKFLNNLQPEWSRHVTIVHQTKDLHTADYTQLYDFLKYNQKEVDELKAERLAKIQDPLALMANSNNPYVIQNAVQNPRVQNIRNQNGLIGVQGNRNQNQIRNGNLVAARAEGNAAGQNGNQISKHQPRVLSLTKLSSYDSDGSAEVHDYENCDDNEIFNMFTQEEQYTELLEPIPDQHQVPRNDNIVISENLAFEVEKVNSINRKLKETNADLTTELARFKNQEKCSEISQEKYDKLERCYQQSVYQEQCLSKKLNSLHLSTGKQIMILNEQILDLSKQLSKEKSTVSFLLEEKKKLKSHFKICKDKLLDKQIQLEKK
uniref:Gag-Pol polyprotein n=1 Tax=Tanacetum cinerariifolium TaxID=118510 RepID=A0A699JK06_TANCI|nr:hypothetical protein [Tanacetum cinerariifolium]